MRKMTRTIGVLLAAVLIEAGLAGPVLACPHYDVTGKLFNFQYNEDYSVTSMVYWEEGGADEYYLYKKDYLNDSEHQAHDLTNPMSVPIPANNLLIGERFNFRIYYWGNTLEGVSNRDVSGESYHLHIGLTNTIEEAMSYLKGDIFEIDYEVTLNRLNDNNNDDTEYRARIAEYGLEPARPDIIQLQAGVTCFDYTFLNKPKMYGTFHDRIDICVPSEELPGDVAAVNLDGSPDKTYETIYDRENQVYRFGTEDAGVYALIRTGGGEQQPPSQPDGQDDPADSVPLNAGQNAGNSNSGDNAGGDDDEGGGPWIWFVVVGIAAAAAVAGVVIYKKGGNNKNGKKNNNNGNGNGKNGHKGKNGAKRKKKK